MASFPEALYHLPAERLRKIVQTRQLNSKKLAMVPNKRQLAQLLSTELSSPVSIAEAITQCNARELRLLQLLLATESGQMLSWEKLLEAAGGPDLAPALGVAMTRLEESGLAFRTAKGVYLPDAVRSYVPASLSDRYTLERCLEQYDALSLKRICSHLGLPQETRPINVRAIKTRLLESDGGLNLKPSLNAQEVAVLEYIVQAGGNATAVEVATSVFSGQTEDFFRYDWQNRWKQGKERNAVDTLLSRGILHVVAYGYGYNLFLIIPGDLRRAIAGGGDKTFWTGLPVVPSPLPAPPARASQHTGLIRDVVALLGYVSAQDALRTNTGHIHKTNLKNLTRTLSLPEERYASFVYAVCREAGLIAVQGEKQVYKITPGGHAWLRLDSIAQLRALVDAWRKGILWGEMYADPLRKSNDYRSQESVPRMRRAALSIVTDAITSAEPFYNLASVTDTLAFRYPLLLGQSAAMGGDLVPSPATFIRLLVGECLYWLGLAELALPESRPGDRETKRPGEDLAATRGGVSNKPAVPDAVGYRLTALGAYLLEVEGAAQPTPEPREDQFIVQANGEIFLAPYLEPATLYHLLAMTEPPAKGGTGNTVSLTRDSIRRCLDQGGKPRDILAFLQGHARTGIPQNVEYLINDVGGKHGHIHIGKAQMYVQVDTPLLLKELEARKELKPYFVRSLSDTVAVLKAEDTDKLLREMRKAGYLPVSDDDTLQMPLNVALNAPVLPKAEKEAPGLKDKEERGSREENRRGGNAETTLDWDRIAQEDGKSWQTSAEATGTGAGGGSTTNLIRNQTLIKTLLMQASKTHAVVEIQYLETGKPVFVQREIEPERVMGSFVNAFDRLTEEQFSFNISRIQWARLTGEIFAPA